MIKKEFYLKKFAQKLHIKSERLKKIMAIFEGFDHFSRLLDIGCGDGSFSLLLQKFSDEVYGVDLVEEAVQRARSQGVQTFKIDIDEKDLPFENNFFDAVLCGEVIEHLYDPDHLLDEIYRVLKPNGICIITTPNLASWHNRIVLLFGFQPYLTEVSLKYNIGKFKVRDNKVSGHLRLFTYRALCELLEIHNFNIEKGLFSLEYGPYE